MMGKNNFYDIDSSEHHQGCIKGMFNHFHNHTRSFAKRKFPRRMITHRKWTPVDTDDGSSGPSRKSEESGEKYDSVVSGTVVEPGSINKRSMRSRIKALISEEVSKRKSRHKRSSSCPPQTRKIQKRTAHHIESVDKSSVQVNDSVSPRSSPEVQKVFTTPCACDLYAGNEPSGINSSEQSREFLEALDLLNMRKELFLNVLRDPCSSLAQQVHEKRLSKSRVRLTKSTSFPCARASKEKDVNFKHESHFLPLGDNKFLCEVKNKCSYASTGASNHQSKPLTVWLDEATPEQLQRRPKPTGNSSPVSPHLLNTQEDKVVIKRFKNLGEIFRYAIKDSSKENQHIIKDAILHKIPNDKNSKAYKGQGDSSEKPSKIYMNSNRQQKRFSRASTFSDYSIEIYNRLLESDPGREAKGRESERPKLRTTVTPSPLTNIPKKLNKIYSSPDLGLYHGLQSEEPLDFSCWDTSITRVSKSSEGNVIYGKQTYLESNLTTENETQMDKTSEGESQENTVDSSEGLDAISKCENIESASEVLDKGSECEIQENIEDSGENLVGISKYESQENFVDDGEGLDAISKCENIEGASEVLDKGSECEIQENIEDSGENLVGISKYESQENFVDDGEGPDAITKCENIEGASEVLDKGSECEIQENIEDAGENLVGISKYESQENFVDDGKGLDAISKCENIEGASEVLDNGSECEIQENIEDSGENLVGISKYESQENFVGDGEGPDAISKCEDIEGAGEVLDNGSECEIQENIEDAGENLIGISKYESQENFVDDGEGLDAISKCENIEDANEVLDKGSECDIQENIEDAGENLVGISKYESQENFVDDGEGLDAISKCENIEGASEVLDNGSECEIQENIEDAGENLIGISKYESQENFVDDGEGPDSISKCENIEGASDVLDKGSEWDIQENIEDAGENFVGISKYESQENFVDDGEGPDSISKCENIEGASEVLENGSECEIQENIEDAGENLVGISKYESQENFVDDGEGLDARSKCENMEGASEVLDKGSECEIQENIEDAGENSVVISKCESQENFVDDGEGLDKMPKCEAEENIVYADEGLKRISQSQSQKNFVDTGELLDKTLESDSRENIEDAGEGSDRISTCESHEHFVAAGVANDLSSQEGVTDPAQYNLPDDKLVVDHLLDGEDSLVSQQPELSIDDTAIYEIERESSSTWFQEETIISQVDADKNRKLEFDFVKAVLDLSGFSRNEYLGTWHSPGQPIDPAVLDEVEGRNLLVQSGSSEIEDRRRDHILLFDLVNEVLLDIYHKSSSYWPKALSYRSCIHPMPMGYHVLEEVWADVNYYLRWKRTSDQAYVEDGDAVEQDLAKYDGWMSLQFDSECVGLKLEELLFDDLIDELFDDLIDELLPDIQTSEIQ